MNEYQDAYALAGLTPHMKQTLENNGIPVSDTHIGRPREANVTQFPKYAYGEVRDILGFTEAQDVPTDIVDLRLLTFENPEVMRETQSYRLKEDWWDYEPTLRSYAKLFGTRIVVSYPSGVSEPQTEPDTLYLALYATPARAGSYQRSVFGYNDLSIFAGQGGIFPIFDHGGMLVGEKAGSTLYAYFDLPSMRSRSVLIRFMEAYKDEFQAKNVQDLRKLNQTRFVTIVNQHVDALTQRTRTKIAINDQNVKNYQQKIVDLVRERQEKALLLEALEGHRDEFVESHAQNFERIMTLQSIESMLVGQKVISGFTHHIYITEEGTGIVRDIGKFRIDLGLESGDVRMYNLTRQISGGRHHPHVNSDGQPCLGNLKATVPRLIAEYQIDIAMDMSLRFLSTYNPRDSWGKYLSEFPAKGKSG